jgi:hypothetical protein
MNGHHSAMEMHSTIQNRANMLGGQGGLIGAGGNQMHHSMSVNVGHPG